MVCVCIIVRCTCSHPCVDRENGQTPKEDKSVYRRCWEVYHATSGFLAVAIGLGEVPNVNILSCAHVCVEVAAFSSPFFLALPCARARVLNLVKVPYLPSSLVSVLCLGSLQAFSMSARFLHSFMHI